MRGNIINKHMEYVANEVALDQDFFVYGTKYYDWKELGNLVCRGNLRWSLSLESHLHLAERSKLQFGGVYHKGYLSETQYCSFKKYRCGSIVVIVRQIPS